MTIIIGHSSDGKIDLVGSGRLNDCGPYRADKANAKDYRDEKGTSVFHS